MMIVEKCNKCDAVIKHIQKSTSVYDIKYACECRWHWERCVASLIDIVNGVPRLYEKSNGTILATTPQKWHLYTFEFDYPRLHRTYKSRVAAFIAATNKKINYAVFEKKDGNYYLI
jgi:hypothetical protein